MTKTIVGRALAIKDGLPTYFTGKPCLKGHVAERRTKNGECAECAKDRIAAWYPANKEAGRRKSAAWRARNPDKVRAQIAKWRAENPEKAKALLAKWRAENPLVVREHAARVNQKNPEKNRQRVKDWIAANPDAHRVHGRNRRARVAGSEGSHTTAEIQALSRRQRGRCAYCGKGGIKLCADHIVPISKGGINRISNIQLTCKTCNSRKHAKDPVRFAQELGFLL